MAFDMHIKFGPGQVKIEGASNHAKHKGEVPIIAWAWGASNSGNLHTGAGYASGGKANVQDITITKFVDSCSNALLNACCTGARVENATLYVTNATGEQTDFVTIELSEGVMVTSMSTGGSGGDERLTENITLHFGKFKYAFQPQDDKGKPDGGKKEFTYDMQQVKGQA
ncbi:MULTISPECIES: type VI secretion system tube protein Hcp [unclassified Luteibacter]|uniref:Hcp family type VI secretion system effector n=1 Tax=unclassified Luteibacter TaxID=2620188 RepID=UPI0008B97F9D|nr:MULTISPECIES: type VI secretion system tube protein Hcp [unclassified Luteibacter]MDR6934895.1 type VI secretion system secreted protein Hcp [Luteibacter sp. 3190]SEO84491.1 type VI secretion system secreted protein Hcp [Luteibacter sp. UNC138MFCol5.1]